LLFVLSDFSPWFLLSFFGCHTEFCADTLCLLIRNCYMSQLPKETTAAPFMVTSGWASDTFSCLGIRSSKQKPRPSILYCHNRL
jgi:hypothetical protein